MAELWAHDAITLAGLLRRRDYLGILYVGVVMGAVIVASWIAHGFGALSKEWLAVVSASFLIVGIQIFFSSFLLSILGLRRN